MLIRILAFISLTLLRKWLELYKKTVCVLYQSGGVILLGALLAACIETHRKWKNGLRFLKLMLRSVS